MTGLVLVTLMTWSAASAVFSSTTTNPASSLNSGSWAAANLLKWAGDGQQGQGGVGDFTLERSPWQESTGATTWNAVSSGDQYSCATRTDGTLWCWGLNNYGQLGQGDTIRTSMPTQVGSATT